jgi:hypothetical protein
MPQSPVAMPASTAQMFTAIPAPGSYVAPPTNLPISPSNAWSVAKPSPVPVQQASTYTTATVQQASSYTTGAYTQSPATVYAKPVAPPQLAQTAGSPRVSQIQPSFFDKLDKNHDGVVSRAEFMQAVAGPGSVQGSAAPTGQPRIMQAQPALQRPLR